MYYVQAFINNISFPRTLNGLEYYADLFDLERILGLDYSAENRRNTEWTTPKWCKKGDIVLFMHSKTSNSRISALKTELISKREKLDNDYFWTMLNSLYRAKQLHTIYGGKIFAIGKVSSESLYDNSTDNYEYYHSKGRIYAHIDSIFLLQNPIDISEFNDFIKISRQSGITPILGEQFDKLKSIILTKNSIVEHYFEISKSVPVPLKDINESNWIVLGNEFRRSFFLEEQFREYYVNWLLRYLGDKKSFYRECYCYKGDSPITYVDNIILFKDKYLPVEVKLSVSAVKDIKLQLSQYCCLDKVRLDKNTEITADLYNDNVLVIDTEKIYLFYYSSNTLIEFFDLFDIKDKEDITRLIQSLDLLLNP